MRTAMIAIFFILIFLLPNGGTDAKDQFGSSDGSDIISSIAIPGADYPQQDGGSDDRLFQYRSMWLEGYQIINHSEVQKVIQVARDSNINCVTPLINAHYLGTFYNSSYHPRYRDLAWDFDPTMDLIREAHKYNIKVMPWFHTMIDSRAISLHPEWAQVTSSGSRSGSWLNPTLPEVQEYLAEVVYQLFRDYPLDGIHLDACRYPSSSYGYDDYSIERYQSEGWDDFNAFRRQQMTEVMMAIYDSISSIRPYIWIGADIGAGLNTRQNSWFQDTEKWSEMGIIDFVTPMIYTLNGASLESTLRDNIARHSCPVVCGNYVYVPEDPYYGTVPDEATGIAVLLNQTERAIKSGALGTCFFAYKFIADHPSYHTALREGIFSVKALCPLKKQTRHVTDHEWEFELDQDREGWRTTRMGSYYPYEGVWSVVSVSDPTFMSPLLNVSASGINVIELSMKADIDVGNITIFWSQTRTEMRDYRSLSFKLVDTGDWNLYSIHIDKSVFWTETIRYIWIVPEFPQPTNITIDLIRMTWMPDCITTLAYLGPFFSGDNEELLDREFIENEKTILPRIGDTVSGREWKLFSMKRDQVDLRFVIGHVKDAVTYSHVYIRSSFEGVVEMRHGNSDGARIWLNGKEVFYHDTVRRVYPDQNVTYVVLKKGINTLMIKQVVYVDDNSFFIRFTALGNITLKELEYYPELPPLGPPTNIGPIGLWINTSEVLVQWEPPANDTGLDHYRWSIDDEDEHVSHSGNVLLSGLSDDIHEFKVKCIDDLGFSGEESTLEIMVDTQQPQISTPVSYETISIDPLLEWHWSVVYEPISSIEHYLVTVERWKQGSFDIEYSVKDEIVQDTCYVLTDDIKDGYRYRMIVKAVSGNGLVHLQSSDSDILVDLTVPLRPTDIDLEQIEYGKRGYLLSWAGSIDNMVGGIEHYEIWSKIGNDGWTLYGITEEKNISLKRPLGQSLSLKVRAKDVSSHFSDFSDIIEIVNQPPKPEILISSQLIEGNPIRLTSPEIIDPDGIVIRYAWYIDGRFMSDQKELSITLLKGDYIITLRTMDDQFVSEIAARSIEISSAVDPSPNTSMKVWLEATSKNNIMMPEVNVTHFDNRTIYLEKNDTSEKDLVLKDLLFDVLLIVIGVPLMLVLFIIFLFLSISETFHQRASNDLMTTVTEPKKETKSEKAMILDKFLNNPSVRRVLDDQPPRKPQDLNPKRSKKNSGPNSSNVSNIRSQSGSESPIQRSKGSAGSISSGFRAAPSMRSGMSLKEADIEVEWDEGVDDEMDEWEEVKI